jgi:hypothetical protein
MKHIALFSALFALFLTGCAGRGLPGPSQVPPSAAGISISVQGLQDDFRDYAVHYSYKRHRPSAVLFLRQEKAQRVALDQEWRPVRDETLLQELLANIEGSDPDLSALVPPGRKAEPSAVLGFVYTAGTAVLKRTGEDAYRLLPVPKQFDSAYDSR